MGVSVESILFDFSIISVLLLIAKIIRIKVKLVQGLYIPTALIAGFMGLIGGRQLLNIIPFSDSISSYAGILIAFLFGTMFLGNQKRSSFTSMIKSVGDTFLVNGAAELTQFGLFILIGVLVLPVLFPGIHLAFGLMLPSGFVGGHGTAAAIGSVLAENGWADAASIGQTFATVGLLGGILGGVLLINIGARKGWTKEIKDTKNLPEEVRTGLIPKEKQTEVGKNTVNAMSIDTISWHLSLVLISVGMAYLVNAGLKRLLPAISFPIYGLALLCSIVLQNILNRVGLGLYVDKNIITHIGSSATDYLVAFGVASININVVLDNLIPIIFLSFLGFLFVTVWFLIVSPRFFKSYWFERGIYILGMSTGVLATGVILLRITDPEFKTGVLEDFGFAWIFLSILDMILVSLSPVMVATGLGTIFGIGLILLALIFLFLCKKMIRSENPSIR